MSSYFSSLFNPINPLQQAVDRLSYELRDLFQVARVKTRGQGVIAFTGRLLYDPDTSYDEIERRFQVHGYTPTLRHEDGEDIIIARQGVLGQANTGNPLINLVLLVVTILTTLSAGAAMSGISMLDAVRSGSPFLLLDALLAGLPFAGTLLLILGVHELGHYVAARYHGVAVTLPYFIPMPFNGLGTLGAFIALKEPMKNRRVLFDVGIAGPLAGFVVALPLLVLGVLLSGIGPAVSQGLTLDFIGSSLLIDFVVGALRNVPDGLSLLIHPVFFAAWLGIFITGINLLPIGQLDGGHVAYALFGRRAHTVARVAFVTLLLAGLILSPNWIIWAFFALIGGLRHPAPQNDITELDPLRRLLGYATILLFIITVIPMPFSG